MASLYLGKRLIQVYGLFWIIFAVIGLVAWDFITSTDLTTIPEVLESVFGAYTPIASFIMLGALGYGLLTFKRWVKYLFALVFILSIILPPYNFTELDIASALFDVLILYLIWVNQETATQFKK